MCYVCVFRMRRVPQTLGSRTILFCCKGVRARVFVFHAATPSRDKNRPRDTLKLRTRANRPKKRQLDSRLNFSVRFFAFSIEYLRVEICFLLCHEFKGGEMSHWLPEKWHHIRNQTIARVDVVSDPGASHS